MLACGRSVIALLYSRFALRHGRAEILLGCLELRREWRLHEVVVVAVVVRIVHHLLGDHLAIVLLLHLLLLPHLLLHWVHALLSPWLVHGKLLVVLTSHGLTIYSLAECSVYCHVVGKICLHLSVEFCRVCVEIGSVSSVL